MIILFSLIGVAQAAAAILNQQNTIKKLKADIKKLQASSARSVELKRRVKQLEQNKDTTTTSPLPTDISIESASQALMSNLNSRFYNMTPTKKLLAKFVAPLAAYVLETDDNDDSDKTLMTYLSNAMVGTGTEMLKLIKNQ